MDIFKAENLTFTYPASDEPALKGVDFTAENGELILIMGRSGSGKTTLLRLLSGALAPNGKIDGEININCRKTAFVGQNPENSFVSETVRGELAFALENLGLSDDEITVKIGETASFFNLSDMLDRRLCELSGGEKAAVSIASGVIADGDALLLDEPFAQLDPKSVSSAADLIRRLNQELGKTIIVISHSSQEIIDFCDRIVILENGEKICDAPPREACQNEKTLDFFPICARIFPQRPFTVKEALPYAQTLKEKPCEKNTADKKDVCVSLKNVSFRYSKDDRDVLKRLNFKAYKGKINSIIGANGSGKTTLLKLIAGIKKPYSGKIKTDGGIAYMPQNVKYLFTKETVSQEISEETAGKLGISDCLSRHPFDLSAGQAQKLAFGILLEQNADVFLLDEPTKAFDEYSKKELKQLILKLRSEGKTIIIVSHDLDFTGDISDCVSFLSDGIISRAGGRREVFSSLNFYTTQVRRITRNFLENAVSADDLMTEDNT